MSMLVPKNTNVLIEDQVWSAFDFVNMSILNNMEVLWDLISSSLN